MNKRSCIKPKNRFQQSLFPPRLEDYVPEDNPVRAIDVYVKGLNLSECGFKNIDGGKTSGHPAYHPGMLLKLYIYGYLNRIRSSRMLEKEAHQTPGSGLEI